MKFVSALFLRLRWLNLPGAMLIALLQRTPVVRLLVTAEEAVTASPVGAVLRSALTAAASLGAVHALAGATQFQANRTSPLSGTVGVGFTPYSFAVTGAQTPAGSYRLTGTLPPGLTLLGANSSGVINATSGTITGTPTLAGTYNVAIRAYEFSNATGDAFGPLNISFTISAPATTVPAITADPISQNGGLGGTVTLTVTATGTPTPTVQWFRNGSAIQGATSTQLLRSNFQPTDTGIYTAVVTNSAGSKTSQPAIVGFVESGKVVGNASEIASDIFVASNGNTFDQVLLQGAGATVMSDSALNQITRLSYVDLSDDIVQVEFSGAGTLSLVLDNSSGPAVPVNYNQSVLYMKGHASIVITGANETTNVSVFTVGRLTAFDPTGAFDITKPISDANNPANNGSSLFIARQSTPYDGVADIGLIAISSTNGKFGGLRTANADYTATAGLTGVYAPGVEFVGPVFIGNISASGGATPVIRVGAAADTRITGGDLFQSNSQPVQVSGLTQLKFTAGIDSHGHVLPAQTNRAQLEQDGANVTAQIVVNPSP